MNWKLAIDPRVWAAIGITVYAIGMVVGDLVVIGGLGSLLFMVGVIGRLVQIVLGRFRD